MMGEPKQVREAFQAASYFLDPVLDRGMQISRACSFCIDHSQNCREDYKNTGAVFGRDPEPQGRRFGHK